MKRKSNFIDFLDTAKEIKWHTTLRQTAIPEMCFRNIISRKKVALLSSKPATDVKKSFLCLLHEAQCLRS
jgi:hypothetical protein